VRRNTEEVQGKGNWDLYEELFADDFVDHTPQPGTTPDKDGVRVLYKGLRAAFPDFRPEIHWQVAAGDIVTTYKTYHGTHQGEFLVSRPPGRRSVSTPSTPCGSSTARSPSTGASRRCST
jgi:predicted ester cyclase